MANTLLFDDQDLLRNGIKLLLNELPEIKIIAEASTKEDVQNVFLQESVEFVIIGVNFPDAKEFQLIEFIKTKSENTHILMLSIYENEEFVNKCIKAGVIGYILKNSKKEEFLSAVKLVSIGLPYISHQVSFNFIKKNNSAPLRKKKTTVNLSERELEILGLIADGYTNGEIADKTFTSKRTIETHRKNLLEKTGSKNSASLIKFALVNDLIKNN